jgi:hypothetical protein
MRSRSPLRPAAVLAASALAGSVLALTAPAAQAAPVFIDAQTNVTGSAFAHDDGACTESNQVQTGLPAPIPVGENGPAVSATTSASVTNTGADPTDVMNGAVSVTGTSSVTSANGAVKALDFNATAQLNVTSTKPVSTCDTHLGANVDLNTQFVVTTPGFLSVAVKRHGTVYGEFYIEMVAPTSSPYYDDYSQGIDVTTTSRLYLPAGTYDTYASASAGDDSSSAFSRSGTVSVHAGFSTIGSQTVAPAGKGSKYVTLGARSCAAHNVAATVTGAKKTAKKIKQVKVFVNDVLVTKVKKPSKGKALSVLVADNQTADVTAEVTLFPKKKGAKAKVYAVSASYEACTV